MKALWLEGNGFNKIEGLEKQTLMRSLYLHENVLDKIEGLDTLVELDTLNLSKNFISKIENLQQCTKLTSLNLAYNKLQDIEGLRHILELPSLQSIDLQQNKIESAEIVDLLAALPDLRVVYLMGNPCVKAIKNYRRTIVSRCKQLKYLDDRPVFDEERRRTDAWGLALAESGGSLEAASAAERAELDKIRVEKKEAEERNFRAFETMMKEGLEIRRQKEAEERAIAIAEGREPKPSTLHNNPFSGERIIDVPENPELAAIREARWNRDPNNADNNENNNGNELVMPPAPPSESSGKEKAVPASDSNDIIFDTNDLVMPPAPAVKEMISSNFDELD